MRQAWMVVAVAACGGSDAGPQQIFDEHKPAILAVKSKLDAIVKAVASSPTKGDCKVPGLTYAKPKYNDKPRPPGTLEIMDYQKLVSPTVTTPFSNLYSPHCETALYWVTANNVARDGDPKLMRRTFEGCKAATHVVVVQQLEHARDAGQVKIRFDLASIHDGKVLCTFGAVASVDPALKVQYFDVIERNLDTGSERKIGNETIDTYSSAMLAAVNKTIQTSVTEKLGVAIVD